MIWTKPPWGHVPAVHLQGCNSFSSFGPFPAGDRRCWRLPWSTAWVLLLHGGQKLWQMMSRWVPETLKFDQFFSSFWTAEIRENRFLMIFCLFWKDLSFVSWRVCYWGSEQMGLVGFQVNLPQRNAELFGIFDFRSAVRCGKPMGGRKSENILIETVRTRETFCLTWRG